MKIKYSKIFSISIAIAICFSVIACLDRNQNKTEESSINLNEIVPPPTENEKITWNEIKLNNLTFSLPTNIQLNESLSNSQKKVYLANDETIGITIDFATLPPDQEGSEISDILPDINYFGQTINEDNKRIFDDFRLINTYYSKLGSQECIEVHQVSKKISGKNTEMNVKANFLISSPNYYNITFSYPRQSKADAEIIQQIKNSFKFQSKSKNLSSDLADFLKDETVYENSSENNENELQKNLDKRYLGKHLFNAYFIDEINSFGSVEITKSGNYYKIQGGQKNNKNEYVEIEGIIETDSPDEFLFIGTLTTYNPTFVKTHNRHREPHNLLKNECVWNGTTRFERQVENKKYWRMRGDMECHTHTGSIDIFFN